MVFEQIQEMYRPIRDKQHRISDNNSKLLQGIIPRERNLSNDSEMLVRRLHEIKMLHRAERLPEAIARFNRLRLLEVRPWEVVFEVVHQEEAVVLDANKKI